MNFGVAPITTTTNLYTTGLAEAVNDTLVLENTRNETVTSGSQRTETESSCTSRSNKIPIYSLKSSKSFTTLQNCFEILTPIQCKVPTEYEFGDGSKYITKSSTQNFASLLLSASDATISLLRAFDGIQSLKPDELRKGNNSFFSENYSRIDSTIQSTLSSTSNTLTGTVSTLTNHNLATESSRPWESAKVQTKKIIFYNVDDNINETNRNESISSLYSAHIRNDEDSLNKSSKNSGDCLGHIYSPECIDKTKNISRLSVRAKKKSWYNVLYPNYKSRSQDFRKLFKEVPNDERLIVDNSCALYRDILIQGRLYVSQNYVCFHANILGWETRLIIKWKEVTSIDKEKTALVIPNAISICTSQEKVFFSSFATRDKTFLTLFRVWQNTLMKKLMPAQELWQLVHNYYGDELGLTTEDEDYIDPTIEDRHDSSLSLELASAIDDTNSLRGYEGAIERFSTNIYQLGDSSSSGSSAANSNSGYNYANCIRLKTMKANAKEITFIAANPEDFLSSNSQAQQTSGSSFACSGAAFKESKQNMSTFDSKRKVPKINRQRQENTNKTTETLPTDISDSSDSEENNIPFVATTECNSPHEGRQLVHTILPINIDVLFNMLFSKSKFLQDFHEMRKSTDLAFGEWTPNEDCKKTRTFNVTVQLAASVGPKTSKVTEFQVMRDCSKPGELYSIDVNNVNSGIPYADSFSVLVHYCLVKTVDDHTMLSVHSQIKYKKSVWGVVKGFIEKNAWAGLDDFYTSLLYSLQTETCIPTAKGKGRCPRRGTVAQTRPPEEISILQTEPEPAELFGVAQTISTRHPINDPVIAAQATIKFRWLSVFVLALLCFFIMVNVIILLKLWKLEEQIEEDVLTRARMPNVSVLKQLPNKPEDWIELLRQQEVLHEIELRKWRTVLQAAIELLKKVSVVCENMFQKDKMNKQYYQINDEF